VFSTVPWIATPMVPPACRSAWINAEPDPARSTESSSMATPIEVGSTHPMPAPTTAIHAAVKP